MAILCGAVVGTIFATIFQCTPISKAWKPNEPGHCIATGNLWYTTSSLAIFADVIVIILPLTQLYSLTISKKTKFAIGFIFCLGFL
jgi:hypothetical protein